MRLPLLLWRVHTNCVLVLDDIRVTLKHSMADAESLPS